MNKLLPIFFSPIVLVCIAIVIGAVTRQRRWSIGGAFFLIVASLPIVADRLLAWSQAGVVAVESAEAADAIVVLGGAMSYVRPAGEPIAEWGSSIDRVFGGIELARAGRAPRLIFAGGSWIGQEGLPSEGDRARQLAIEAGVPAERTQISPQALNTAAEAETIRKMFGGTRPKIILVTSAFHIPRAKVTFEAAGFEVLPYPVDFRVPVRRSVLMNWLPSPDGLEKTDLVIREAIGRAYYRLRAAVDAS